MTTQLTAQVDLAGAKAMLDGLAGAIKDVSPVFRGPIDAATTRAFEAQFATQGTRLNGAPWQPLSPTTIALRTRVVVTPGVARTTNRVGQARAGFATILRNTNTLWSSFVKSGGPLGVRIITPSSYERGSRVPYAALQQTGFTLTQMFGRPLATPRKVPARRIVPEHLPTDLVLEYETAMLQWLQAGTL